MTPGNRTLIIRKFTLLALSLTLAATPLFAQSSMRQAPIPGPYMVQTQQPKMSTFTQQRFAMPMPYWMQNTRPQQAETQPAVGRAQQHPADTRWSGAPIGANPQSRGSFPTPGFFPGYNSGQQSIPNNPPYPAANFAPRPWGQQGFWPMPAPQQYGQPQPYGQNGWGNNWNTGGYGRGYAAPNRVQR